MTYLYDGVLTRQVADWVSGCLQDYPHAIETSRSIDISEVSAANPDIGYVSRGEDCTGQPTTDHRKGLPYATMPSDVESETPRSHFYFFRSRDEQQLVINHYPDAIMSEQPFKTTF